MPYRDPIFYTGGYYHVYSRGSEKRVIFLDKADKGRFLDRLEEYKNLHNVKIIAYCLMPNHYHLLIQQNSDEAISKFISRLNLAYAMYFNKRYERVGPLFQGRFKAKHVETDEYLLHLSRYIHLNPLSHLGERGLRNYHWSSLKDYLGDSKEGFVEIECIAGYFNSKNWKADYKKFIKAEADEKMKQELEEMMFEPSPAQVRVLRRAMSE
jgi:REP element-mobilizing transposase RayT